MSNETKASRLAAAKRGGTRSAALRREHASKLETFRASLMARCRNVDPVFESLIDCACSLYAIVIRRSALSRGVNAKVNMLGLSATITGLRATMRDLGALGPADLDAPPGQDASLEERQAWSRAYVQRRLAEKDEQ